MALAALAPLQLGDHTIDPPIVLAPMAAVSESPYRIIALEMGAGLAPTELISAKALARHGSRRTESYLKHDPTREPVLSVQLYGGEPELLGRAAAIVRSRGARMVDLNMGCPVKKVTKNGAGSALMLDPDRAQRIIEAMRAHTDDALPITAKIRAGWDRVNAAEVGRALEAGGVAAIAIHGRTRAAGYSGRADWGVVKELVSSVSVPVIANGDIFTADHADRVVEETGCAAVMIGRAALGNPWVFRELEARYRGRGAPARPTGPERIAIIERHLSDNARHHGDASYALRRFRQHLIWYSRGLEGADAFRRNIVRVDDMDEVLDRVRGFFGAAVEVRPGEPAIYDERAALG